MTENVTSTFGGIGFGPNADGAFNLVVGYSGVATDQALAVAYSPNGTVASGYGAGVYVSLAVSGTSTGGFASTQQNAFAADVSVNGTHTCGIGGIYIYMAAGTASVDTAQIYGGYFDIGTDFGTVDYLSCITLDKHNTTKGTTVDAFILCQFQGSGTGTSLIHMQGPSKPTYFLNMNDGATSGFLDATARDAASSAHNLIVRVGGTTFYIPLLAAT
jgi:hypothetical protein